MLPKNDYKKHPPGLYTSEKIVGQKRGKSDPLGRKKFENKPPMTILLKLISSEIKYLTYYLSKMNEFILHLINEFKKGTRE